MPFDGLPNVLDPDEGFVVTANQAVIGPDYPYFLTADWDQRLPVRADPRPARGGLRRGRQALGRRHDADPARHPQPARRRRWCRSLLTVDLPRGYWSAGQRLLRRWDFEQPADSAAAEYFNVVWRTLLEQTFHDEMVEDVWPSGGDRWMAVVTRLLDEPDSSWWDDRGTEEVEKRDDILRHDADRGARRGHQLDASRRRGLGVGPPPPARAARADAR